MTLCMYARSTQECVECCHSQSGGSVWSVAVWALMHNVHGYRSILVHNAYMKAGMYIAYVCSTHGEGSVWGITACWCIMYTPGFIWWGGGGGAPPPPKGSFTPQESQLPPKIPNSPLPQDPLPYFCSGLYTISL